MQTFGNIIYAIICLIACLLVGYGVAYSLGGLPASLYGMIVFTLALHFKLLKAEKIEQTIAWCLKHMGVCFVPAGVGIIEHYQLVKNHGIAIVAITFATTFLVLTFVGIYYQKLEDKHTGNSNE
jgi:holin-like protein